MYLFRFSKDGFVPKIQSHHIHQLIEFSFVTPFDLYDIGKHLHDHMYQSMEKVHKLLLNEEQMSIFNEGIWTFLNDVPELPYHNYYHKFLLNHIKNGEEYTWWTSECPDHTRIYSGIDYDFKTFTMKEACQKGRHDGFLSSQDYIVTTFQEFSLR